MALERFSPHFRLSGFLLVGRAGSFFFLSPSLGFVHGYSRTPQTTLISILSGLFEPTSGEAIIDGKDVRSQMSDIYGVMGVCPQFDVLWPDMSGREHLQFFGRIKGLKGVFCLLCVSLLLCSFFCLLVVCVDVWLRVCALFSWPITRGNGDFYPPAGSALDEEVSRQLDGVRLQDAKNRLSKKYSGGMKRRLSVAISLMGDPKVVFLDGACSSSPPHCLSPTLASEWSMVNILFAPSRAHHWTGPPLSPRGVEGHQGHQEGSRHDPVSSNSIPPFSSPPGG